MYPVLCVWNCITAVYVPDRNAANWKYIRCPDADLYAGVMSCGVAYTLQILGQKHANPAIASLLLSMESCFSVLSGWIILGETLSAREGIGCVLMFVAIILAQLPDKREKLKNGQA